jgi:hypothetical protein
MRRPDVQFLFRPPSDSPLYNVHIRQPCSHHDTKPVQRLLMRSTSLETAVHSLQHSSGVETFAITRIFKLCVWRHWPFGSQVVVLLHWSLASTRVDTNNSMPTTRIRRKDSIRVEG